MNCVVYELEGPRALVPRQSRLDLEQLGPSEVGARTVYSVVSPGTELAAWRGEPPLRPSKVYPRLLGYCNLAKVVQVGSGVDDLAPGDWILTHQSHCSAFVCKRSQVLLKLEDREPEMMKGLAATYLFHLAYAALFAGDYRPGCYVSIVGIGTLGLAAAILVRAFGGEPLLFTSQEQGGRTANGEPFHNLFAKRCPDPAILRELCGMEGVDISINTSNQWSDHLLSLQLARKGGRVVCLGFPGRGQEPPPFNPLDSRYFYDKQLSIRHCGYSPDTEAPPEDIRFTKQRNLRFLSELILRGRIDPRELLSIEVSWAGLQDTYARLESREAGVHAALLDWLDPEKRRWT